MIPFIDLKSQYNRIKDEIQNSINTVLEHGYFINGPEVAEAESKLAEFVGIKHCIACSSGTDALVMALMSLDVGRGDEVIVPNFTFFATAEAVEFLGATPIFADIDPLTYNMNVETTEKLITKNTKAIVPVSLYGQCSDLDEMKELAEKHNIKFIEDAAQSFGGTYKGKKSCSVADISCTSFFPAKPLGVYGDGGAVFTNSDELNKILRQIRSHGEETRYHHTRVGINGRFDTIQAAIIIEKLKIFDDELDKRKKVGNFYDAAFKGKVKTPYIAPDNTSAYAQYTIQVENRDEVSSKLKERGIPTAVHYPGTLTNQKAFEKYKSQTSTPVAEELSKKVLSLPMHPYLSEEDQNKIITAVLESI
jgi:UDP-2-acetamido-2-deoxy-ribo-hexuluronate aminotransferase